MTEPVVAIAHDYLTQRGGAERVVLLLAEAFPGAPIHTSMYEPDATFPEFSGHDVRVTALDGFGVLRHHHRLAFPALALAFSRTSVDADVVIASSSGWAHGIRTTGAKIVYCHTPARWLYQPDKYGPASRVPARWAMAGIRPALLRWDRNAAASADLYVANSTLTRDRIRAAYGREAEIVHPPSSLDLGGPRAPVDGIEPGFGLVVSRLLPYKNVRPVIDAFRHLPAERLIVVGDGPELGDLQRSAPANVTLLGQVTDDQLRWLYASSRSLIAPSWEDFGLTPIEAAAFGRPTIALRWGGYLDTVVEGETGLFFDDPTPAAITRAIREAASTAWSEPRIRARAAEFSPATFSARIREIVVAVGGTR
jgi:glycosyltransferase involved in cell wall biosynthesis